MLHHVPQTLCDPDPVAGALPPPAAQPCPACGIAALRPCTVSSIFWREQNALMVHNIPALVCASCGADFIAEATARGLEGIKARLSEGLAGFDGAWLRIPLLDFAETGVDLARPRLLQG